MSATSVATRSAPARSSKPPVALLSRSWWLVRRPPLVMPALLALLLALATTSGLEGQEMMVLRGVGVLLASAWVVTMDDPMGEVLAASPYPRVVRAAARALAGLALVLPVWVVAAVVVEWRAPGVPVLGLGVQALALCVAGLAIGAALRAKGRLSPSYVATIGLVVVALLTDALPRGYAMTQGQTWGPPWEAAQVRWAALLLLGVGVLVLALRDPLSGRK